VSNDPDASLSKPLAELVGHSIAGRYRIVRLLGRGGIGAVYEAEQIATGMPLAIKVLLPGHRNAKLLGERFKREAKASSLLDHPNIIEVLDLVAEGDDLYLVMELLRGSTVGSQIQAGPLGIRRSLVLVRQVLEALDYAHDQGMIHRDLKPENMFVTRAGEPGNEYERVKLLDFGLVKLIGDAAGDLGGGNLTATGIVFGTPAYLAPEQALGKTIDGRTDLYSLGVVLFEMLTGRLPFRSQDPLMLTRMHVSAPPPTLASVAKGPWTAELEILVARALAKLPDDRFATAAAMTTGLDGAFRSLDHLPPGI
jgi:serine/threonine-protein kinase